MSKFDFPEAPKRAHNDHLAGKTESGKKGPKMLGLSTSNEFPMDFTGSFGEASSRPKDEASQEGAASKPKVLGDYSQRY